ncbi:MAG: methionine ABC transporter substrate-binding protein [Erysipelotrichaceae bacterium]|nr:methionine ABC transporter substrate-binding protein [Erysipelotrichaceae bacterium]
MKKLLVVLFALLLLVGCSGSKGGEEVVTDGKEVITVACTAEPHATILEEAAPLLAEKGYELKIEIWDDYYIFNSALENGDVDANYFQHIPFFNNEVSEKGYDIANAGGVHIEPFGFYSKRYTSVDEIQDGDTIVISNSVSDHGRILAILDDAGLIKLADGVDAMSATLDDVAENPKNLQFVEVKPELLTNSYEYDEGALVAINGNYAIAYGLNPTKDAVILESAGQDNPYVNIVACRTADLGSDKINALVEVLQSDAIRNFISEKYSDGSVIPAE